MPNQQLLLSIGIPSLLIVLAWFQTNVRLTDFKNEVARQLSESRSDSIRQFAEVNKRLDGVDSRLEKFTRLEGRVDELSRR